MMNSSLESGQAMPEFDLDADASSRISSSDLKGHKAVIYFYPKDDTPGCTKEAIAFTQLKQAFEAADTMVVGISADTAHKHDKFIAKHDLGITLGSDPELDTLKDFGVWVQKAMYGRKYFGIERSTFLIDADGKVAKVWRKVRVAGHAEEVLKAAEALD
ncbi:MAG: peroxiredoxin [Anderseniella sp.]